MDDITKTSSKPNGETMDDITKTNNMPNVAAMDLGTNSSRLLIADGSGCPVYRDVKHVALGEGLAEQGCFCKAAMERAICSFMDFRAMMDIYGVAEYRAVATAACRMSANTAEFVAEVKKSSGIALEVISEYEEARLTLKGAKLNAPKDKKYLLVYDLGGGSTEVTLALNSDTPQILTTVSIPLGARNATEKYRLQNYQAEGAAALKKDVLDYMSGFLKEIAKYDIANEAALIATSSTPLRLAAWIAKHPKYDKFAADGEVVTVTELDKLIDTILLMSREERAQSVYLGQTRAEIFIAAAIIFRTIYRALGCQRLTASLKGAQEAIVQELCAADEQRAG